MNRIIRLRVRLNDIKVFLLGVLCICFLSPTIYRTVGVFGIAALTGIYLLLQITGIRHSTSFERNTMLLLILYAGMLLLYTFLGKSEKGAGQTDIITSLLPYFLIIPAYKKMDRKQCLFILTICFLTILITLAQNYALWVRMGYRFTQQWYRRAGIKGVVNTQYVSAIMLFSGILLSIFMTRKKTWIRHFCLAMAVLCFTFNILVTQRTITLLLSIIMFALLFLVNGRITRGKIIRYSFFIIIVLLFALEYQTVLNWIAGLTNSDRIIKRIDSINRLVAVRNLDEMESGSLTSRLRLMGVSIQTFWSSLPNFLFGVGDKTTNTLVGNHSYFFDEFAKFGIFGGFLGCVINIRMLKAIEQVALLEKKNTMYHFYIVLVIVMILRGVSGGVFAPSISVVLYIFTPLAYRVLNYDIKGLW